jgi:hypothetical protein
MAGQLKEMKPGAVPARLMPPAISPHSLIIVHISERHSSCYILAVEMRRNQLVVEYYNGLLAADSLQKQPGALRRPTVDCASLAWKLSPDHVRTRFPVEATASRGETRAPHG